MQKSHLAWVHCLDFTFIKLSIPVIPQRTVLLDREEPGSFSGGQKNFEENQNLKKILEEKPRFNFEPTENINVY